MPEDLTLKHPIGRAGRRPAKKELYSKVREFRGHLLNDSALIF